MTGLPAPVKAVVRGTETLALRAIQPEGHRLRKVATGLSASASGGRLWAGLAAGMALHPRLRPAGRDGLAAWGVASAAAFGIKTLAGRERPRVVQLLGAPTSSSSMPSSHTAGAVAFAGAAALRNPATALVVGPLAVGVAWSRAATGRHFPTDVAVGAGLGALAALGVHLAADRLARPEPPAGGPVGDPRFRQRAPAG